MPAICTGRYAAHSAGKQLEPCQKREDLDHQPHCDWNEDLFDAMVGWLSLTAF